MLPSQKNGEQAEESKQARTNKGKEAVVSGDVIVAFWGQLKPGT